MDEIIFLGDYIGSYNLSNYKILGNLREIIAFKKDYPQKVVLLWGNHDVLFLTGYSEDTYVQKMYDLFAQYKDLFQIAYQTRNYLFTHAGLTRVFWQEVLNRMWILRKWLSGMRTPTEQMESIREKLMGTKSNFEFLESMSK